MSWLDAIKKFLEALPDLAWWLRHFCETRTRSHQRKTLARLLLAIARGESWRIDEYVDTLPPGDDVTPHDVDGV